MDMIWMIIAIPIIVGICVVEYALLRIKNRLGLIIPLLSVISIIPLGILGIILTLTTFLIYFIQSYILDWKRKRQKEMEKMQIEDL